MEKFGKVLAILVNSLLGISLIIELADRLRARNNTTEQVAADATTEEE